MRFAVRGGAVGVAWRDGSALGKAGAAMGWLAVTPLGSWATGGWVGGAGEGRWGEAEGGEGPGRPAAGQWAAYT